ncbi:MAG: ABC transporter permease [Cellulomonas sp.]|uniref:ABC transporter permease n=1 Tax=Cellulomonas sp. TaxID=40001 RepID=UPI00258E7495|nr:ABC transporter permease [Cellulomonas sp.]MCR6703953.1 ABC transporter permease [Cellulomonas sp.]
MLLAIVFLLMITVFSFGLAAIMATLQVYFRDTSSFLPFFTRIWLYLSPVLWTIDDLGGHGPRFAHIMLIGNPLFSLIGGWNAARPAQHGPRAQGVARRCDVGRDRRGRRVAALHVEGA